MCSILDSASAVTVSCSSSEFYVDLSLLTDPDVSATTVRVGEGLQIEDILFGNHKILADLF